MTTGTRRDSNRDYYWIAATEPTTGKPYLIWGGNTEDEARQKGLIELPGVNFDIIPLKTRNQARASSMYKGGRLQKTHSLTKASERLGHDRSAKTARRKRQRNNYPLY